MASFENTNPAQDLIASVEALNKGLLTSSGLQLPDFNSKTQQTIKLKQSPAPQLTDYSKLMKESSAQLDLNGIDAQF